VTPFEAQEIRDAGRGHLLGADIDWLLDDYYEHKDAEAAARADAFDDGWLMAEKIQESRIDAEEVQ
jgi:hypothetical protein